MDKVKKKQTYAVQTGDYVGQMFIVCEVVKEGIGCLSVPDMKNIIVPTDKWTHGISSKIIEYVETLPKEVYLIAETQYIVNRDKKEL